MFDSPLTGLVLVVVLGIAAQWLAWRFHLPSILLLLLFGILAGPIAHWLAPDELLGDLLEPIVAIAVGLILFEGGLSLQLWELRHIGRPLLGILTIGTAVTWAATTVSAWALLGLDWSIALLVGAILIVSGPTVVGPILRQVRPSRRVSAIARWEGIVIDPVGVLLAVIVYEVIHAIGTRGSTGEAIWGLGLAIVAGGVIGLVGAGVMITLFQRFWVPDHLHNAVAVAVVIGSLFAANSIQEEAGLLAVTILGIAVANQKLVPIRHIVEFKENLRVLLISGVFVLLAARLEIEALRSLGWGGVLFLLTLIVLIRPTAVFLATLGTSLKMNEKLFLGWLAPRGIVAAAMSSVVALQLGTDGHAGAEKLVPIVFCVIIGTVVVYGLTVGPIARKLGLAHRKPQGVLFIGAHAWAREIAKSLFDNGFAVQLIDSNRENTQAARLAGLPSWHGNVLSEEATEDIDLYGIGKLVALTSNDDINALAALHFVEAFSREQVYQPSRRNVEAGTDPLPPHLRGRRAFGTSWSDLASRYSRGAKVRVTQLTEEFGWKEFQEYYGKLAVPLFVIDPSGSLKVVGTDESLSPQPGQKIVSLAQDPAPEKTEGKTRAATAE